MALDPPGALPPLSFHLRGSPSGVSEEWRAEHHNHLMAVDECPYCRVRTLTTGEEPPAKIGTYCMVHGVMDCAEPDCWRCGNHQMDEHQRCSDPRCRALNDPAARSIARIYPGEIEVISYMIATDRITAGIASPHLPSLRAGAGDAERQGVPAPTEP